MRGRAIIKIFVFGMLQLFCVSTRAKCVQIFYDQAPKERTPFYFGRVHALFLQNLLGHFPGIQQYVIPVEKYQRGQIDRCEANFYLGTFFNNAVPADFVTDFEWTKRNVLWAGYNVWMLGDDATRLLWGVRFTRMSTLDTLHRDEQNRPAFYKYYEYKGQTFEKYGEFDKDKPDRFNAAYEISLFDLDPGAEQYVESWAVHSYSGDRVPYVLHRANHWYIGDSPFSFMTESDRYLIFSDLLFDVLDEPPRRPTGKKPAVIRIEDVHPRVPLWQLYRLTNLLIKKNVPFSMTIIPIFVDPYGFTVGTSGQHFTTILDNPYFIDFLKYARAHGATFAMHGVTHQYGSTPDPFTAVTADDFEFWDRDQNAPVPEDSAQWVVNRLEDGYSLLDAAGVPPQTWVCPHYEASPLDYIIFGQLFYWNFGRVIYFPFHASQARRLPDSLSFTDAGTQANGQRLPYFSDLKVSFASGILPAGQIFPYEIYGDVYGQRLLPEDVGNVQPYMNEQVYKIETVDDLIKNIKRNVVLRDAWGSFFVHPFLLMDKTNEGLGAYPGDTRPLERLIQAVEDAGYEFVDLKEWMKDHGGSLRPAPIETP